MNRVYDRVKKVIVEQLGVDESEIIPEASFTDDLNADSLDLVELVMALEEEFSDGEKSLEIPDQDAQRMQRVQDVLDYIREQGIED